MQTSSPVSNTEACGHDLNPQARPHSKPLPLWLRPVPFAALLCLIASIACGIHALSRLGSATVRRNAKAAACADLQQHKLLLEREDAAALQRLAEAESIARWVTASAQVQRLFVETLENLPASVAVHRLAFEFPEPGRQVDVSFELSGNPEALQAVLPAMENSWLKSDLRVSSRDPVSGTNQRQSHRLSLTLATTTKPGAPAK
jgi:hypothetical protein